MVYSSRIVMFRECNEIRNHPMRIETLKSHFTDFKISKRHVATASHSFLFLYCFTETRHINFLEIKLDPVNRLHGTELSEIVLIFRVHLVIVEFDKHVECEC